MSTPSREYHYTYMVYSTNHRYYGRRSTDAPPERDVKYMGSGARLPVAFFYSAPPKKEILGVFNTFLEAVAHEYMLIECNIGKLGCVNRKHGDNPATWGKYGFC